MGAVLSGLFAGLSLIVAIGAQNAFVLRQGIRREHVGCVVLICALSDLVLIGAGVLGVGALITAHPMILLVCKWAGAAYLAWFAIMSFRSAARPQGLSQERQASAGSVVATAFALTWLNPHVYLDTVVMLGNIANQYGAARWWFALGAGAASIIWFAGLGFGARALARPLAEPRVWRVIDIAIGFVMIVIAITLIRM